MVKKLICFLITTIFLLSLASAMTTNIKVKTLPFHEVQITTCAPNSASFTLYERFKETSDEYGDVSFDFSSDKSKFDIIIFVKKNGETVITKKYLNSYSATEDVYIEIAPSSFEFIKTPEPEPEPVVENITEEVSNETENLAEEKSLFSGFVIFGEGGILSAKVRKIIYYVVGIIVLLAIIFFIVRMLRKKGVFNKSDDFKVRKLSELRGNDNELLENAERKIKEAQDEIRKIKNEDKIALAKKKLEEDEKELLRLRRGEE